MIDSSKLLTINQYDEQKFRAADNSWFLPKLSTLVGSVLWDVSGMRGHGRDEVFYTPREMLLSSAMSAVPFYYLGYLHEINPVSIIDIGCGANLFKPFFKNLIGFDPCHSAADITKYYNTVYETENKYDAAFAICSLHFVPIEKFSEQIHRLAKVIKPGGRGYITFNIDRIVEKSNGITFSEAAYYCNSEITKLKLKLIVVDQIYIPLQISADNEVGNSLEGNIRIVFEKE